MINKETATPDGRRMTTMIIKKKKERRQVHIFVM
jgi:hypothetical protein